MQLYSKVFGPFLLRKATKQTRYHGNSLETLDYVLGSILVNVIPSMTTQ